MAINRQSYHKFAIAHGLRICAPDDLSLTSKNWFDDKPVFTNKSGKPYGNKARIKALKSLAVPPAWKDVRFAHRDEYHMQAIGVDARGRTQYRYHPEWVHVRNEVKTLRLLEIGRGLPSLRDAVAAELRKEADNLNGVSATAVRLIDNQLIRVGSEQYLENGTAGCATLPNSAFIKKDGVPYLRYKGKSGRKTEIALQDKKLIERVADLNAQGGPRLFTFVEGGEPQLLRAHHINTYIREASGKNFTAKDFRTFKASSLALNLLCDDEFRGEKNPKMRVAAAVRSVSKKLRNTPAVCRSSYVHPTIIEHALAGKLDPALMKGRRRQGLSREETGLMRFLES